jgi:hypothetical protein
LDHGSVKKWLELFYFADLFEGYLWLQLGISVNAFPPDAARELVRQRFAAVFPGLPSFLDSWGYVLGGMANDLVMAALSQKEFFAESTLSKFYRPELLRPSFQSALLLETRFARDTYARGFVTARNFRYEDLMEAAARASIMNDRGRFADLEREIGIEPSSISRGLPPNDGACVRIWVFL